MTPNDKFLKALNNHISARITEGVLPLRRMHEREREAALKVAQDKCATTQDELEDALKHLLKDARRPGI